MLLPHNSMIHLFVLFCPDYYMIVQSTQGGVDIYDEADTQSVKLNDSKIPNGTAIHVLGEKNGADNKKWAYAQYHCYYCSKPSLHNLFPSFPIFFLQQMGQLYIFFSMFREKTEQTGGKQTKMV